MRDYLLQLAENTAVNKLGIIREYLQECILKTLQEKNFFRSSVFVGGTALRFVYNVPRFSEDLDFSGFDPELSWEKLLSELKKELALAGYQVSLKIKNATVLSAMIKFAGIAYETGLSGQRDQLLNIKLEIDTRPPAGGHFEISSINKRILLSLKHYDLSSLYAGKLNALLTRSYTKGRDIFDIFWLKTRYPELEPNLELLANSLQQYGFVLETDWRKPVLTKLEQLNWPEVLNDLENFVEERSILKIMTKEQLLKVISRGEAGC